MTEFEWKRRYLTRGLGWIFLLSVVTILYLPCSACTSNASRAEEARQKGKTRQALKAMFPRADEDIRKYNESQTKWKKPARREK